MSEAPSDSDLRISGLEAMLVDAQEEAERLRAQLLNLRISSSLLATHVLGHFAMPSATSPEVCKKWAEAVQKAIAENSQITAADSAILIAELRARIKDLETALRPFAEAHRRAPNGEPSTGLSAIKLNVSFFARAAELLPEETT